MAAGDNGDIVARLKATLPTWFSDSSPVLDALLSGWAASWSFVYALLAYVKQQSRLLTASDGWLDMIAGDFFGLGLQRQPYQTDQSYRTAIQANIFRERGTRAGVIKLCQDITGRTPILIEAGRPQDYGAYGQPTGFYGRGRYGTLSTTPYECFVKVYRPLSGTPQYGIADADIYAAIDAVRPHNVTVWVQLL